MTTPRKFRGEYRPIGEALFTGADYSALAPSAKLILLTLKGLCGATGIKYWPVLAEALAELTGYGLDVSRQSLDELIEKGWVEWQDRVVWVVRGLEFEPQISTSENHRKWVASQISGLPRSPIVDRFRERYAEFLPAPVEQYAPEVALARGAREDSTTQVMRGLRGDGRGVSAGDGQGVSAGDAETPTVSTPLPHPTTTTAPKPLGDAPLSRSIAAAGEAIPLFRDGVGGTPLTVRPRTLPAARASKPDAKSELPKYPHFTAELRGALIAVWQREFCPLRDDEKPRFLKAFARWFLVTESERESHQPTNAEVLDAVKWLLDARRTSRFAEKLGNFEICSERVQDIVAIMREVPDTEARMTRIDRLLGISQPVFAAPQRLARP